MYRVLRQDSSFSAEVLPFPPRSVTDDEVADDDEVAVDDDG
jgi:hypothetical protein